MTLYRSRPTVIEAVQHLGNFVPLQEMAGDKVTIRPADGALLLLAGKDGAQEWVPVPLGHWLVSQPGDRTDIWPVEADYFTAKYEPVDVCADCDRPMVVSGEFLWCPAGCGPASVGRPSIPLAPSVTLAEIDEQREKGWPDFHPEDYCHRCGGRNVHSWSVDSDRFNMAFGPPDQHPFQGIVCPGCFVFAHERATGLVTTWVLLPDPASCFRWIEDS